MPQPVQRTLVVTSGPIATQAGQLLQERLRERHGPKAAVAVVSAEDDKVAKECVTSHPLAPSPAHPLTRSLTAALTQISPTTLAAQLSEQGYSLDPAHELTLFLLIDTSLQSGEQAIELLEEVSAVVRSYLGMEANPLLIWLSTDPAEEATTTCLTMAEANRYLFSRGILALGPLNEAGLRLPGETALASHCADCLWLLIATPLQVALEWLAGQNSENLPGSLGFSSWEWDNERVSELLQQRWLSEVIGQWVASTSSQSIPAEVVRWIEENGFTPSSIKPQTLTAEEQQPPQYDETAWYAPWPWELPGLFAHMAVTDTGDQERHTQRQEWADLRLEEPLHRALEAMRQQLQTLLNEKPVGGVALACQWVTMVAEEFNHQHGELLQEADLQNETDAALSTVRGELEAELRSLLQEWPESRTQAHTDVTDLHGFFSWVKALFKPWKWPRLAWRYWQLRSIGQQLALVYYHQAKKRRQQVMMTAALHACTELEQIARRFGRQAEEIGDMLHYVKREIGDWRLEIQEDSNLQSLISHLYSSLTEDPKLEAETAASATGGLGKQLVELDDGPLLTALRLVAAEQMSGVKAYSAVSILQLLYPTPEIFCPWWQGVWDEATPLWRYDPASLPERVRAQETAIACLCGAGVTAFAENHKDWLPQEIRFLESEDKERLFLLRLRGGLMASAMTRRTDEGRRVRGEE